MHIDVGENNVSDGLFVKSSGFGAYQFGKTKVVGGCQFDLKSSSVNIFTGSTIKVAREFSIEEFPFEIQRLLMYNPFSKLVHESNWGLLAKIQRKHFTYKLGTNFRTYQVTKKAINNYNIESNKKIHEYWNLMYLLRYNIKPNDYNWNIGISLTNIDHFTINQETNPFFYLHGKYKVTVPLTIYVESWYKSAGAFNISVNYFGFFFRTGLLWKIDLNK